VQRTERTEVTIRVPLRTALHKRLRLKAFDQGLTLKAATIAAIEAWVAPEAREAQVRARAIQQVLDLLDEGFRDRDLPGARKKVLALLEPWE
jgi:hypothetical protein